MGKTRCSLLSWQRPTSGGWVSSRLLLSGWVDGQSVGLVACSDTPLGSSQAREPTPFCFLACLPEPHRALQGNHPQYVKAGATCKHFMAYSLEEWEGISRFEFDARLDPRQGALRVRAKGTAGPYSKSQRARWHVGCGCLPHPPTHVVALAWPLHAGMFGTLTCLPFVPASPRHAPPASCAATTL
jgi:hypothetical protein